MNKLILFLVTILSLSSCITRKACERKFPLITSDSVKLETVTITHYRDTTIRIYLPGDTVYKEVPVTVGPDGLINSDVSFLKGDLCASKAWVKNEKLFHELMQPDTTWLQTVKNAIARIEKSSTTSQIKIIEKPVNYVTSWQWFQIWTGRIALAFIALCAIIFLLRKFPLIAYIRQKIP